jgi:hypothetical protein
MDLNYERIAFDMRTQSEVIDSLINEFGLFKIKNGKFYSESILRRLHERDEKSNKARESVLKRWNKESYKDTNVLQNEYDSNTIKEKKSKVKESKVNNNIVENIYSLYPSKCPINNSLTGKSKKNKIQIEKLLKDYSEEQLIKVISQYIDDCKKHNRFIKNFSTFLNNIPEIPEVEVKSITKVKEINLYLPGTNGNMNWPENDIENGKIEFSKRFGGFDPNDVKVR